MKNEPKVWRVNILINLLKLFRQLRFFIYYQLSWKSEKHLKKKLLFLSKMFVKVRWIIFENNK